MQSKATTVAAYLAEVPADRRASMEAVRAVILKNLDPEYEEGMQYGMIGYYVPHRIYPAGYHCDPRQPLPFVCLASQKSYMSVYLSCLFGGSSDAEPNEHARWFADAWARTGKRLDMGKSCIRFRRAEDLALDVLGEAIRRMPAKLHIKLYEQAVAAPRRGSTALGHAKPGQPARSKRSTAKLAAARRKPKSKAPSKGRARRRS